MKTLVLYEPAMCCSTGLCGPSIDPQLLKISLALDEMARHGIEVRRYNLSAHPKEFMVEPAVAERLQSEGVNSLPLTLVDGVLVKKGAYPSPEEIARWSGLPLREPASGFTLFKGSNPSAAEEVCCSDKNSCDLRCKPGSKSASGCTAPGCC